MIYFLLYLCIRMAALKRSGEEEWKKRNAAATANTNAASVNEPTAEQQPAQSNSIGLVKQQQQQLKQQLLITGGKPMPKNLNNELKRAILAPLNDNVDTHSDESNRRLSKLDQNTNETPVEASEEAASPPVIISEKREKRMPIGARIIFNPSDLNADLGKIVEYMAVVFFFILYIIFFPFYFMNLPKEKKLYNSPLPNAFQF
jgi:hypothetical protein